MKGFWVFKIQTTVFILGAASLSLSQAILAQTPTTIVEASCSLNQIKQHVTAADCPGNRVDLACLTKWREKCRGATSEDDKAKELCTDAKNKLGEARREFTSACSSANMPGSIGECASQINSCSTSSGSDDILEPVISSISERLGGQAGVSPNIVNKYSNCPSYAARELDDFKDEVKELKESVRDKENDLVDLHAEYEEAERQMKLNHQKIMREIEDLQKQAENQEKDIIKILKENQAAIQAQVDKLRAAIRELRNKIQDELASQDAARVEEKRGIRQLNIQCHSTALKKIEAEIIAKREKVARREYSAGSQRALFKSVNLDSKTAFRRKARGYFADCVKDLAYLENLRSLNDVKKLQIKTARRRIHQYKTEILEAEDQITRLLEKELPNQLTEAQQAMIDNKKELIDNLKRKFEDLETQLNADGATLRKLAAKISLETARMNEDESYAFQKESLLLAREAAVGGGGSISKDDYSKAFNKYADYSSAVREVKSGCKCSTNPVSQSVCDSADQDSGLIEYDSGDSSI